jgi:3-deoxy-D-manno-octulosonic-acid transferase
MNALLGACYAAGMAAADVAAVLTSLMAPNTEHKVLRSLRARRGIMARWAAQGAVRDVSRPLVWWHAPSVGEGLQARPVAQAARRVHPDWQQAYSFYSPSAELFARSIGAELSDYLPFDRASSADTLLQLLRPSALVFAKLDVWPVLVARARQQRVPVALVSATLSASSGRRGLLSSALLRDAYAALDAVGAIDAVNAERLVSLGVRPQVVDVTGDTRFDQVAERAASVNRGSSLLTLLASERATLVAGSTWPADEAPLCAGWEAARTQRDAQGNLPRLIIAPHEPTASHVEPLQHWATRIGARAATLSGVEQRGRSDDLDVVIVDRVGVLGELYALAHVAFVGGGFHAAGLHSVIEPAAFGVPVLFGPQHHMSREAGLLLQAGAGFSEHSAAALQSRLTALLFNDDERRESGARAAALVEAERGATARSLALVKRLVLPSQA